MARPTDTSSDASGGPASADNYSCVPAAQLRLDTQAITLGAKGIITAYLTLPAGYIVTDWDIRSLALNGALGTNVSIDNTATPPSARYTKPRS